MAIITIEFLASLNDMYLIGIYTKLCLEGYIFYLKHLIGITDLDSRIIPNCHYSLIQVFIFLLCINLKTKIGLLTLKLDIV